MSDAPEARPGGDGPPAPADGAPRRRYPARFLAAVAVVVALDQATKSWALAALDDGPVDLIGTLRLRIVLNDGAAFSMISGRTTVVAVVAALITAAVAWLGLRADRAGWALGFGIIVGGASGNLVDRAFRSGEGFFGGRVVDFIDLQWWPVFNLADSAIFVGVGVMLLLSLRDGDEPPEGADGGGPGLPGGRGGSGRGVPEGADDGGPASLR